MNVISTNLYVVPDTFGVLNSTDGQILISCDFKHHNKLCTISKKPIQECNKSQKDLCA